MSAQSINNTHKNIIKAYVENINAIKMLSSYQGENLEGSIFLNFKFNDVFAKFTKKPLCSFQIGQKDFINVYNQKKHIKIYLWSCISIKNNGAWLNYIIKPSFPRQNILLFSNLVTGIILIIIGIFCWILLKIIIPTRKLENNAYELGMSLIEKEVKTNGIRLLGRFSNSINFIQHRLFKALKLRTKMLSMIAHDLKSPVARLKLRHELGLVNDDDNLEDLELLEKLCQQLLFEIKDDMFSHEMVEQFNFTDLIIGVISKYKNITMNVNTEDKIYIKGRRLALYRAFENLISNAKKYSDEVTVNITKKECFIEVDIKDYGVGIKESEIKNIFRPFYQVNNMKQGNGLGLTIVHEIITNHNGVVSLANHYDPHGVIANVKLPI
ncbi:MULTISPECIES: sensor histidine kinase [unclassified Francisella]|uniref:sensor histidine kinase n=1 Tax=unclassified Francisella TaxID=2610885 RepID=UPI002E381C02|nr:MULTISPECIES: HAMP domain-containing sensor histidine kinase [unclassified Francisella]MED7818905.1 HAMP domain-containing sensor histidine kinase [Francisella sp. 19S2-4]MED7829742.1 HAMP domain-containing sensor histidine kinase [Francisella sp. 19S2-10]